MKIIADAGSTKVQWAIERNDGWEIATTDGLNPITSGIEQIKQSVKDFLSPLIDKENHREIFYYGAGCVQSICPQVADAISQATEIDQVMVCSDMLGTARSICGRQRGIACILGTGSNSCLFDGEEIEDQISPLGYILGDEGSGASLGKRLIGDLIKRRLSQDIADAYNQWSGMTQTDILHRVYNEPNPNRWLATNALFIKQMIDSIEIDRLVVDEFERFFERNVEGYDNCKTLPVNFTGSIATNFRHQLETAANNRKIHLGNIIAQPIEGLISYHSNTSKS